MTEKKPSIGYVYLQIARAMNGLPAAFVGPPGWVWPYKTRLIQETTSGAYSIVDVDENNVCKHVNLEEITHRILRALEPYNRDGLATSFDPNQAKLCAKAWLSFTSGKPEFVLKEHPTPIAVSASKEFCYHKLPFTPSLKDPKHMPTWEALLKKMTNAEGFCMFIYSLLERESDISQYLYIYGEGGSGKSSIASFVQKLVGPTFTTAGSGQLADKHWSENLVGKRLVYVKEASSSFCMGDKMKSLCGDRQILINPKGRPAYMTMHNAKFMFVSNYRLELSSKSEDLRRAIYCELSLDHSAAKYTDQEFQELLWSEAPSFLAHCMQLYLTKAAGRVIPIDTTLYEDIVSDTEAGINSFIEQWFVPMEGAAVFKSVFQEICNRAHMNRYRKHEVLEHLRRNHKVSSGKRLSLKDGQPKRVNAYVNLALTKEAKKAIVGWGLPGIDQETIDGLNGVN